MKKVIKLTESDLEQIVKRVIKEQSVIGAPNYGMTNFRNSFLPSGVKEVQKALTFKGYYVGKNGADGILGPDTKSAIIKFQKANRIKQTGNVGPITAKALGVQPLTPTTTTDTKSKNKTQVVKKQDTDSNNFENINASRQVKKQLQYMKSNNILSDKKFTILDDKNSRVYEIEPGYKVVKSYFVLTGKNKGDELKTKTFQSWVVDNWKTALKTMYNSKDDAVKDVENAYFAQDEWKVKNTPSGIFKRAGVIGNWLGSLITTNLAEETYGKRFITWETLDGNTIPFGFHGTQKPERLPVLNNANEKQKISQRKMSFGCINFKESDVIAIDKFIDAGQISVWLPDATDDIVQFPSSFFKKQDINRFDKYRMSNRYYTDPGKI